VFDEETAADSTTFFILFSLSLSLSDSFSVGDTGSIVLLLIKFFDPIRVNR